MRTSTAAVDRGGRHRVPARRLAAAATAIAAVLAVGVLAPAPADAAAQGFPLRITDVVAVPGPQPNEVTVTWAGGGRANKVAVVAGANATVDRRAFHSAWYPPSTRTITVTVPTRFRALMGAGTGNPVWIKVVQSNSASTAFGAEFSIARAYRPTPAGVRTLAGAVPVAGPVSRLVVGELNTQSEAASARFGATNRWAARVGRLAASIDTATKGTTGVGRPALLLTSELTTKVLDGCENHPGRGEPYRCRSRTQVADLAGRLTRLRLAGTDAYDRVIERGRRAPAWQGRVTNGAHVFYDPAVLTVVGHGYYAPAMAAADSFGDVEGLGVAGWTVSAIGPDRWLSWARLRLNDSGREFLAVAVHLPAGDSKALVAVRAEVAAKLAAAVTARAGGLPVVLGGDMNGDATTDVRAAQARFVRSGFSDASATAAKSRRTGADVNTANLSGPQTGDPGYGARPVRHPYDTSRIDFILMRGAARTYRYANVLRLHADGSFRRDLQGSDHNLQLADVGIGDPLP